MSHRQVLLQWATSRFSKTVGVYTASNVIAAAVPFLLLPVLTRCLTTEDMAAVAMFQVLIGLAATFAGVSVQNAIARRYYDREQCDFPAYVGSCVWLWAAGTALVAAALWLAAPAIERWTKITADWLWLVVWCASAQVITRIVLAIWQVRVQPTRYAAFQIGIAICNAALTLLLVVGFTTGWQGRVVAQLTTYAIFCALGLGILQRLGFLRRRPDPAAMRHALGFGVPLLPVALAGLAVSTADRVLVENLLGSQQTGVFVVAAQIGLVIGLLQDSFHRGWLPWFCEQIRRRDAEQNRRIVLIIYAYDLAIVGAALLLAAVVPWIYQWFIGADFRGGADCVLWVGLGLAFNGMYKMRSGYLFYERKTHLLSLTSMLIAAINIGANAVLIPRMGIVGAAQATALSYLAGFAITWVLAARVHKSPWGLRAAIAKDQLSARELRDRTPAGNRPSGMSSPR